VHVAWNFLFFLSANGMEMVLLNVTLSDNWPQEVTQRVTLAQFLTIAELLFL
jgi:uncharacterized protein YhhL (DUF1145 family)